MRWHDCSFRAALPLMTEGGSVITLTYHGGERVVPKYNIMGVAKAALEHTVRYLASDIGNTTCSRAVSTASLVERKATDWA